MLIFPPCHSIGTPLVPSESVPPAKAAYNAQDLVDWSRYWGAVNAQASPPIAPPNLTWPDEFPIRSVVALRVVLLEPKAIAAICTFRPINRVLAVSEMLTTLWFLQTVLHGGTTNASRIPQCSPPFSRKRASTARDLSTQSLTDQERSK